MKPHQDSSWDNIPGIEGNSATVSSLALPPVWQAPAAPATQHPSILRIAWERKLLILCFLLTGLVGGLVYVTFTTPVYSATATLELIGINTGFMGMDKVDTQASADLAATVSNIGTTVKLLTNRSMLLRAIRRINLESAPVTSPPPTFFTKVRARIPLFRPDPLVSMRTAVRTAALTSSANGVGATRLIEVKCQSTSPQVAANYVNTLASEYVAQSLSDRAGQTQKTSQWLDSQLDESKARLEQANDRLRQFVQTSGLDFFPEQANQTTLAETKLKSLQGDVSALQADRIAKQSRWEVARNATMEDLPDIVSDPALQSLKSNMANLRRDIALLTSTLTPEHYKVKRVQAQLDEAEKSFEKEKTGVLLHLKSEYEEAQRRENLLSGAYNRQTHVLTSQADKTSKYAMLRHDVESEQNTFNLLKTQSNQAALNAIAPANKIRVVDPASPTTIPANPVPERDIPVAGLLGILLGVGLVWLLEIWRRKNALLLFDAPGHTRSILGVPELGVIPSALIEQPKIPLRRRLTQRPGLASDGDGDLALTAVNGSKVQNALAGLQTNKSTILAESFRHTLVSLLRRTPKDHSPVYVITSSYPGEGKTTLSANLASAMADIGKRVLLVDADLRRASIHAISGTRKDHPGLSDILASAEPIQSINLDAYLQPTRNAGLQVLTHGETSVETPALLFFSPRVQQLVTRLQSMFDCVIFDTAPALAFPDARLWGRHSDGIVLVVRSGVTTKEGAAASCQRFLDDGIPVLGTILNDWEPADKAKNAYAYGYYYATAKEAK